MLHRRSTKRLLLATGALLLCYTAVRAYTLSITWDEAYGYLRFVRNKLLVPESLEQMDANNHLLHTFLCIRLNQLLGASELVLRLPSLAGHALFLFFSYRIVSNFQGSLSMMISFLILNVNPFVLDFFSLSRGYGLALGFMIASVYFLYKFFMQPMKIKYACLSFLSALLATLANFTWLNYFVISFSFILLILLPGSTTGNLSPIKKWALFIIRALPFVLVFGWALYVLVPYLNKLKEAGAFFFGGTSGFYEDTFCSLGRCSLYGLTYPDWMQTGARIVFLGLVPASVVHTLILTIRKKSTNTSLFSGIIAMAALLCCLATIVQHKWLGNLYLLDRNAVFFLPLFHLAFVFLGNELSLRSRKVLVLYAIAGSLFAAHFIRSVNFSYTLEWKFDADIKHMLSDLDSLKRIPKEKSSVSVGVPLIYDQPINFYRATRHLTWLNMAERSDPVDLNNDYLYLRPEQLQNASPDSIEVLKKYSVTNSVLARPKYKRDHCVERLREKLSFEREAQGKFIFDARTEYSKGFTYTVNDSVTPGRNAEIVFRSVIMAPDLDSCNVGVIMSFERKKSTYLWKRLYVKDFLQKENEWTTIHFTWPVPQGTNAGDMLHLYFWNWEKQRLYVKEMEYRWLSAK